MATQWVEKYRPKTLDEYVFDSEYHKSFFNKIVETGEVPNLLLTGPSGTGKTSLARILIDAAVDEEFDILTINCSDMNSVDDMREVVTNFAMTCVLGKSKYKVVEMAEADYLSLAAQSVLRHLIEEVSDNCRFIFTCNYSNKIIAPIQSRLQKVEIKSPVLSDVVKRVVHILKEENVTNDMLVLANIVKLHYPDMRKIINVCEQSVIDGKLTSHSISKEDSEFLNVINNLKTESIEDLQKLSGSILTTEFEKYYQIMYRSELFNTDAAYLIIISEYLYKHYIVGLPEINFCSCLLALQGALNEAQ